MYEIDSKVTWKKRQYTVTGYAMAGKTVYLLHLRSENGVEITLRSKQIAEIPRKEAR